MLINMHALKFRIQIHETDIAALVDQQALRAGNYVGVTEFFFTVAPINLRRAPMSCCQKSEGA